MSQKNKLYEIVKSYDKVGVEFNNDKIEIYFPLGYNIEKYEDEKIQELEEKKSILDLLKTVSLCKNNGEYNEYGYNNGINDVIPINSYLWVLNDYIKNGLYNVVEKKSIVSQKGKINWKKTFRTKPLFTNDEIIYLNTVADIKTSEENIITEIHTYCVNKAIYQIGWLFGRMKKIDNYNRTYNNEMYINILNRELNNSFNDRKKSLLKHLIKIVREKTEDDKLDNVNNMLVNNYNYAWEKMINQVYGNVSDKSDYFPEIVWDLHNRRNPKPTMRPDTIIKKKDEIYIIDAKYYKYGVKENGSLPGVESIDKQITYGEYNSKKNKKKKVYNAFIMPFNMHDNLFKSDVPLKVIGTVKSVGRLSAGLPYESIVIILLDTKHLIDMYFKREKKDEELLLKSITNEFKSISDEIEIL